MLVSGASKRAIRSRKDKHRDGDTNSRQIAHGRLHVGTFIQVAVDDRIGRPLECYHEYLDSLESILFAGLERGSVKTALNSRSSAARICAALPR